MYETGLPDGIFSNQKYKFGQISECLEMKAVGKVGGHLVYLLPFGLFTAIWSIYCHLVYLLPFGIFCVHMIYFVVILVYFLSFWYICPVLVCCTKKNLATLARNRLLYTFRRRTTPSNTDRINPTICVVSEGVVRHENHLTCKLTFIRPLLLF
jgi:hypothetical protein